MVLGVRRVEQVPRFGVHLGLELPICFELVRCWTSIANGRTTLFSELSTQNKYKSRYAAVAELADAQDLKSCVLGRAGSSPASRTDTS